jgi:aryl-alcohol dehydrogenase-like predicted oxidoreductase
METLKDQGKIRYWGISLNTYHPFPEAEFALRHQLGSGFQFVLNIINQRALDIIQSAYKKGYGLIARMPFQFGLLTGKFSRDQSFKKTDHRHIRLKPEVLRRLLDQLEDVWPMAESYHISPAQFSLSYILSFPEISTVIPGMRSEEQVKINTSDLVQMKEADKNKLIDLYRRRFETMLDYMKQKESES